MLDMELTFENPDTGEIWKYYPSDISYKTERTPSAGVLTGTVPNIGDNRPPLGATCRFRVDGYTVFIGYVFQEGLSSWNEMNFTAYDCIRYLKNPFSMYYYQDYQPRTVIEDMCYRYQIKIGSLVDIPSTGYALTVDNESCLDVIAKLVENATIITGEVLVFFSENDKVYLMKAKDMISDVLVGEKSLATDYNFTSSIDDDTFNEIALYRESQTVGGRAFVDAKDEANVTRWGPLCMMESCDDAMTNAKMHDKARKLLEMKDRPFKSMSIEALGVLGLRAGMMITIHFPTLKDSVSRKQQVLIDSIEHKFADGQHTMSMEVRTFWRDTPDTIADIHVYNKRIDQGKWIDDPTDWEVDPEEQKRREQERAAEEKKRKEQKAKKKAEEAEKKKNNPATNVKEKDEKKK